MVRYLHADANLQSHIHSLRILSAILAVSLISSLFGWHYSARTQRISFPPDLKYGGEITANSINPWEVYNFAGYIWQQLNRCPHDCAIDYPQNLDRLTAFITPAFKARLLHDSKKRISELTSRTRYILPVTRLNFTDAVSTKNSGNWIVTIDVELKEFIGGVEVKSASLRYYLKVVSISANPEHNPWGLMLDLMPRVPERLREIE